jgi:Putative metal-binding motif
MHHAGLPQPEERGLRDVTGAFLIALFAGRPASAAEAFEGLMFYIGDPHAHTGVSGDAASSDLNNGPETSGEYTAFFDIARRNGLDWVAMTDHVQGNPAADEDEMRASLRYQLAADDPEGGFVVLPGAETWYRTAEGDVGHKTLLMFGTKEQLADLTMEDMQANTTEALMIDSCESIWDWMAQLTEGFGPAFLIPHHPAATEPMPTDWSCASDEWEPGIEVYSGHGSSMEAVESFDPIWSGAYAGSTVHDAMDPDGAALRRGFLAGTDSHDTRPGDTCSVDTVLTNHPYGGGLTIAVLDIEQRFDRSTLYDAIENRRTYATSGPFVPATVHYNSGGAQLGTMGDNIAVPPEQDLQVELHIAEHFSAAMWSATAVTPDAEYAMTEVEDGVWTVDLAAADMPSWVYVRVRLDGTSIYDDDEGCSDGGATDDEYLWMSPSWIGPGFADVDGDGFGFLEGDCDDGDPRRNPDAWERYYDGIDQNCDGNDDDFDGDGFGLADDCNDRNPYINPDAVERWYDGVDQDCDGADDDQDVDGWAFEADCDDRDAKAFPGATEVWYDGVDQDCDGRDDDQDSDGWGVADDCDDTDAGRFPGMREVWYDGVDQNCDGNDNDRDGDGSNVHHDCDDRDPARYPGAPDPDYDGIDSDCDHNDGPRGPFSLSACASVSGLGTSWMLGLSGLVALLGRRRR